MGRLYRNEEEVGLLLVRLDVRATAVSGHWWWTKWSPTHDSLWEWVILDGTFSDHVVEGDAADRALADYAEGRFMLYGEALRVVWTTPGESSRLRQEAFGDD